MGNIFSNKSFMNRYFSAPKSTGPGKMDPMHNGEPGVQKEDFEQFSGPAKTVEELEQKKKDMQLGKHRVKPGGDPKNVKKFNKKIGRINKRIDNKSDDEGAGPAKRTRAEKRLEKTKEKAQDAKDATRGKKSSESEEVKRQANKAKRLDKKVKRQEGRAERKKIRKIGYTDAFVTRDEIKASRKKQKSEGPAKKEPKRVKIESEGMDGQGSTEYIRGGREGDKNARSVTIEKDYAGKDQKVVRRKKKDGSVKTKSKKISSKRAERIKKRKDKSHSAVS